MPRGLGTTRKKMLLLLSGGLTLLFSGSPKRQLKILSSMKKEWEYINKQALYRAVRALYRSQLVDFKDKGNGAVEMILTRDGKKKALRYNIDTLSVQKTKQWDGKWRIICFDIPKDKKKVREALRFHLRRIGFRQLQKSIFIFPYPCRDEMDFLIEFYDARPHVRQITAVDIDNAFHLRKLFNLS